MRALENYEITVGTMIVPLERLSRKYSGSYVTHVTPRSGVFYSHTWCYANCAKGQTYTVIGERFGVRVSNRFETLENR